MLDAWAGQMIQQTVDLADHHDQGELFVIWAYRLIPGGLLGLVLFFMTKGKRFIKAWWKHD